MQLAMALGHKLEDLPVAAGLEVLVLKGSLSTKPYTSGEDTLDAIVGPFAEVTPFGQRGPYLHLGAGAAITYVGAVSISEFVQYPWGEIHVEDTWRLGGKTAVGTGLTGGVGIALLHHNHWSMGIEARASYSSAGHQVKLNGTTVSWTTNLLAPAIALTATYY